MISYIKYIIVRLMQAVEEGDIEIIDMWEEGDGDQDARFVKRKLEKSFTSQDEEWQKQWQLRLYPRSMDYVIADENKLCKVLGIFWERQKGSALFGTLMSYVRLLRRLALSSSIRTRVSRTAA